MCWKTGRGIEGLLLFTVASTVHIPEAILLGQFLFSLTYTWINFLFWYWFISLHETFFISRRLHSLRPPKVSDPEIYDRSISLSMPLHLKSLKNVTEMCQLFVQFLCGNLLLHWYNKLKIYSSLESSCLHACILPKKLLSD